MAAEASVAAETDAPELTLAGHPRAVRSVARAKAWGGLAGFLLGGYLSLPTHTVAVTGLRALAAGAIFYVATWAAAVFAWRRVVVAELRGAERRAVAAELSRLSGPERPGAPAPAAERGRARVAS